MGGPGRAVRWGILGAGGIAGTVGAEIMASSGSTVAAVAARNGERARALADSLGAPRSYGSYRELVDDAEVDVVYIATTHGQHHEHALLALRAGKPVLVEKAFTLNAAQAREVVGEARARGLFCMEAMWMRFNPLIRQAVEVAGSGSIGELLGVRADLSGNFPYDPAHRLFDLAAGGGALLDMGVYAAHFAWLFLGRPSSVVAVGRLSPTGSDLTTAMQWGYSDGRFAQIATSAAAHNPATGLVTGTAGWLRIETRLHRPSAVTVFRNGQEEILGPSPGTPFAPEIAEVERCLRTGLPESPLMPLDDTVALLEVLDDARRQVGVHYAGEAA